jgi:hypothetical protein
VFYFAKQSKKGIRQASCQQPLAFRKRFCEAQNLLTWLCQVSKQKQKGLEKAKKVKSEFKIQNSKFKIRILKFSKPGNIFWKTKKILRSKKIFAFQKRLAKKFLAFQNFSGVPKFFWRSKKFSRCQKVF